MKNLRCSIPLIVLITYCSAFIHRPQISQELFGKWNLRGSNSKLIGTIEIRNDGKYFFVVAPNYKESGNFILRAEREPAEIDLIKTDGGVNAVTKGIYKISNNGLELCLGKLNEARPATFNNDPNPRSTLWLGTK